MINQKELWEYITSFAKKAGRVASRPMLLLYYVMKSPDTPSSDKMLIVAAISYLVLPIDLIPAQKIPIIGWIDELVSITYAYNKVCKYITPEMEAEVDRLLDQWFPDYSYEIID